MPLPGDTGPLRSVLEGPLLALPESHALRISGTDTVSISRAVTYIVRQSGAAAETRRFIVRDSRGSGTIVWRRPTVVT
jgi:hypothetical protein